MGTIDWEGLISRARIGQPAPKEAIGRILRGRKVTPKAAAGSSDELAQVKDLVKFVAQGTLSRENEKFAIKAIHAWSRVHELGEALDDDTKGFLIRAGYDHGALSLRGTFKRSVEKSPEISKEVTSSTGPVPMEVDYTAQAGSVNVPTLRDSEEVTSSTGPIPMEVDYTAQAGSVNVPTLRDLIEKFKSRPYGKSVDYLSGVLYQNDAYLYSAEEHQQDLSILETLISEHNTQFQARVALLAQSPNAVGLLERAEIPEGAQVFVRADIHSDLKTLLAQLEMLKELKLLDENYHCAPHFHMIFLGDYGDRGHNDAEVVSLLLKLRMENPESVHLLRGNHEDVDVQEKYSVNPEWATLHRESLQTCYATLPLAFYLAEKSGRLDREGRREYAHFSHALFSTLVDPAGFLESTEQFAVVQAFPKDAARYAEIAKEAAATPEEERHVEAAKLMLYAQDLENYVMQVQTESRAVTRFFSAKDAFMWSDPGAKGSYIQPSDRGIGELVSPEVVQAFTRARTQKVRIAALFHGHGHKLVQTVVERKPDTSATSKTKVIETTLPVGTQGGIYAKLPGIDVEPRQGLLFTVRPRMRNWRKAAVLLQGDRFVVGDGVGLFDEIPPLSKSALLDLGISKTSDEG